MKRIDFIFWTRNGLPPLWRNRAEPAIPSHKNSEDREKSLPSLFYVLAKNGLMLIDGPLHVGGVKQVVRLLASGSPR